MAIMCIEYTYSWPTFNGALVDEMSPNPVYFSYFSWGSMSPDPPSYSMLLHYQNLYFFLKRTYPH